MIFLAVSCITRPPYFPTTSFEPSMENDTPCWISRLAIVFISVKWGMFDSERGSSVNSEAAMIGKAAFFAPAIMIFPFNAVPP